MSKVDSFHRLNAPMPFPELEPAKAEDRKIRANRIDVHFPVVMTHHGAPIQGFVEAVNLSWSGMLLVTNFPLNAGDKVRLEFTLPGRDLPLQAHARVVRKISEERPEEATQIGVMFIDVDPQVQKILNGYVLENLVTN